MIRNEEIYKQALTFRKRGFTYTEIAKICGVSHSTVYNWCKGKRFSKKVATDNAARAHKENAKRVALLQKARTAERTKRYAEAEATAVTEFRHYKKDPAFIAALTAYAAAGDKTDTSRIRLSSQQAILHRVFVDFLQTYLGVDTQHIKFWVLAYQEQPENTLHKWWSKQTGIPKQQFGAFQTTKTKKDELHYGTGNTIIGSTVLKRKLIKWLELLEAEL